MSPFRWILLGTALLSAAAVIVALWLYDALTVTEAELKTAQDGSRYYDGGSLLDGYLSRCIPSGGLSSAQRVDIVVQGFRRQFYLQEPLQGSMDAPVIIVLHGSGSSAWQVRVLLGDAFHGVAQRDGAVVIYAEGFAGGWNDLRTASPHLAKKLNIDDVAYLREVLSWAEANIGVDRRNVYFFGMSNGAQMILRVLVQAPELVTAAAMVGANLPVNPELSGAYATIDARPVMFVNGTEDSVVPYKGGAVKLFKVFDFGQVYSVEQTLAHWLRAADLNGAPQVDTFNPDADDTSIDRMRWVEPGKPEVRAYRVDGGQHTIPMPAKGSVCDDLLSTSHDMSTVEEAWQFFRLNRAP